MRSYTIRQSYCIYEDVGKVRVQPVPSRAALEAIASKVQEYTSEPFNMRSDETSDTLEMIIRTHDPRLVADLGSTVMVAVAKHPEEGENDYWAVSA